MIVPVWRYCPLYRAQIKTILIVFVLYLCPYKHRAYLKKSSLIGMQRDSYPFGSETQRFHQLAWDSLKLLNAFLSPLAINLNPVIIGRG
jgi:hypothetical protein